MMFGRHAEKLSSSFDNYGSIKTDAGGGGSRWSLVRWVGHLNKWSVFSFRIEVIAEAPECCWQIIGIHRMLYIQIILMPAIPGRWQELLNAISFIYAPALFFSTEIIKHEISFFSNEIPRNLIFSKLAEVICWKLSIERCALVVFIYLPHTCTFRQCTSFHQSPVCCNCDEHVHRPGREINVSSRIHVFENILRGLRNPVLQIILICEYQYLIKHHLPHPHMAFITFALAQIFWFLVTGLWNTPSTGISISVVSPIPWSFNGRKERSVPLPLPATRGRRYAHTVAG